MDYGNTQDIRGFFMHRRRSLTLKKISATIHIYEKTKSISLRV